MQLVEITIQGVRRFAKGLKLTFQPSYNVIVGFNETGKTTIFDSILAAFDHDYLGSVSAGLPSWNAIPGPDGQTFCRVGIRLKHKGGGAYFLQKDFKQGATAISSFQEMTQKFEKIGDTPSDFENLLSQNFGLPSVKSYRSLFTTGLGDLPSFSKGVAGLTAPQDDVATQFAGFGDYTGMGAAGGGADDSYYNMSEDELKAKFQTLKEELFLAEEIDKAQFEIDGWQQEVDQIDHDLKNVNALEGEMQQHQTMIESRQSLRDIGPEITDKVSEYGSIKKEQDRVITNILEKLRLAEIAMEKFGSVDPFFKTPIFIVGVALAIGAGVVGLGLGQGPIGGIMLFAGLGTAGFGFWKNMSDAGGYAELKAKVDEQKEAYAGTERRYAVVLNTVDRLMKQNGVDTPKELLDKIQEYQDAKNALDELERKKREMADPVELASLTRRKEELETKMSKANSMVQQSAAISMDMPELKREIEKIESILGLGDGKDTSTGEGSVTSGGGSTFSFANVLDDGLAVSGMSEGEFISQVGVKFNFYISGITAKRYPAGTINLSGDVFLEDIVSGRQVGFNDLTPSTKDAVYFAVKFAIYEVTSANVEAPVIFDDPFSHFDDQRVAAVANALKYLSKYVQIIHLTGKQFHAKMAAASLSINKV